MIELAKWLVAFWIVLFSMLVPLGLIIRVVMALYLRRKYNGA